jgi:hypothetical protein
MSDNQVIPEAAAMPKLLDAGLLEFDARTALAAFSNTPPGQPYGADAIRVAAILGATK